MRLITTLLRSQRLNFYLTASSEVDTIKPDGSPVTVQDRNIELLIIEQVLASFPKHGVLSEETSPTAPATDWTWVIDPIDGTANFAAGLPYWCVSVALCLEGAPVVGMIYSPAIQRQFSSVAGEDSEERGLRVRRTVHVQSPVNLYGSTSSAVLGLYAGGVAQDLLTAGVALDARVTGSSALNFAMVASGVAPLAVAASPRVWDIAAGARLVIDAGGAVIEVGDPPLLPLTPGRDYSNAISMTAAASDESLARSALEAVVRGRSSLRES